MVRAFFPGGSESTSCQMNRDKKRFLSRNISSIWTVMSSGKLLPGFSLSLFTLYALVLVVVVIAVFYVPTSYSSGSSEGVNLLILSRIPVSAMTFL